MSVIIRRISGCVNNTQRFYKDRIKYPIVKFVSDTAELYKQRTLKGANNLKELIFRGCVIALVVALLIWLSILMYFAFYYAYVPYISHSKPIYVNFKPCSKVCPDSYKKGTCSFPSAHVELTKRNNVLMVGQPYRVEVNLDMPESEANTALGMFMVCADFRTKTGKLTHTSCRSAMLRYQSPLLYTLKTIVFSPALLLGFINQKQNVRVELFSEYEDDQERQVTDVYIEIQTLNIEIYSAQLVITAHFSGLRYFMFHWPMLSASIGISSNLFFIALISILSWYQLIHSEEYLNYKKLVEQKQRLLSLDTTSELDEEHEEKSSSSGSVRDFVDILAPERSSF